MHFVADTPRQYSEVALFLALVIGFWFGGLRFGSFSLGTVTSTLIAGLVVGHNAGLAAGLLAGDLTNSGAFGVATANVQQLGLAPDRTAAMASLMAIAYAVTYPFGTAGSAWFLSPFAPKLLGIDLRKACQEYEAASKAVRGIVILLLMK